MSAAPLIDHLDGVRETGPDRWLAKCPAHKDEHPSLSIARGDDRWLIHCFSGCFPADVMEALGLELADLFDDRKYRPHGDREKPKLSAGERLELLAHESQVTYVIACDFARDRKIDEAHIERLAQAAGRIARARWIA